MYDRTLAHRILEKLNEIFPRKLHLHELQEALPEYEGLPGREWLSAVEALRLAGKLSGDFLSDSTSLADAAALYITERGRLQLHEPSSGVTTESADRAHDYRRFAQMAIDEARKSVPEDERSHPKVGAVVVKNGVFLVR